MATFEELESIATKLESRVTKLEGDLAQHPHEGGTSTKISPKDLRGFPVYKATPTHDAEEGTIVLVDNETDTRKICAMLGGTWYCSTLS